MEIMKETIDELKKDNQLNGSNNRELQSIVDVIERALKHKTMPCYKNELIEFIYIKMESENSNIDELYRNFKKYENEFKEEMNDIYSLQKEMNVQTIEFSIPENR
jgi:hypothetical protein